MDKEKLSHFLYKTTERSPKWQSQYNEIIRQIISAEANDASALKSLSTDQKISVALNLSKMRHIPISMLDWTTVAMRIESGMPTSIVSKNQVHPRLLLSTSSLTTAEASIIFSFHPYEWADTRHILLKFTPLEQHGLTKYQGQERYNLSKKITKEALSLAYKRFLELKITENQEGGNKMESAKHKLLKAIWSVKRLIYLHTL